MSEETIELGKYIFEFSERLGDSEEPDILTLTEKRGFVLQTERFNRRQAIADTSKYKVIRKMDIAFNPYLLWAGAVALNSKFDSGLISPLYPTFRVGNEVSASYIIHMLKAPSALSYFDNISFGSVERKRRATVKDFLRTPIPNKSYQEQIQIAKVLDLVEKLNAGYRKFYDLLDSLQQSIYFEMFEKDGDVPRKEIGEILRFTSGKFLPALEMNPVGGIPVFGANGVIGHHDVAMFTEPKVVVGRVGSCGKVNLTNDSSWVSDNAFVVEFDKSIFRLEYLYFAIRHADLGSRKNQSSQPLISFSRIRDITIPCPNLDLQDKFLEKIRRISSSREVFLSFIKKANSLSEALFENAFNGTLLIHSENKFTR